MAKRTPLFRAALTQKARKQVQVVSAGTCARHAYMLQPPLNGVRGRAIPGSAVIAVADRLHDAEEAAA